MYSKVSFAQSPYFSTNTGVNSSNRYCCKTLGSKKKGSFAIRFDR